MTADEELDWIRDRLATGESPEEIIDELIGSEWTESGARQAVWRAVGKGIQEGRDECLLCKVVPAVMSALALIIAIGVAFVIFTGQSPLATPINETAGPAPGDGTDTGGTAVEETIQVAIAEGLLSAPTPRQASLPARLDVTNTDDRAYTLTNGGLGISERIEPGGTASYRITQAGTYTLRLQENTTSVTFSVE